MSKEQKERGDEAKVHCRRLDCDQSTEEHLACPYCHGALAEVQTGNHKRFCDFKPGEDPIVFGFPPNIDRFVRG